MVLNQFNMTTKKSFDVIIVGGSYSGLAAAMALGRSLRRVLVIDSGNPCNRQTPFSHNFLTHDGKTPGEILAIAREQVSRYSTVEFLQGLATKGKLLTDGFEITVSSGETFVARKVIFATGITDIMPAIEGVSECWGISVLHCPYCHGYEVRNQKTGVIGNGDAVFEYVSMISNWTKELTLYTNGKSTLTLEQTSKLAQHNIEIVEDEISSVDHQNGYVQALGFTNGNSMSVKALYMRASFIQHSPIPASLGCELTEDGYIKSDGMQKTNVPGVFVCGDNTTRMRTVANAVAMGATAGMMANKDMIMESF
jgi:thioredoxin reductase